MQLASPVRMIRRSSSTSASTPTPLVKEDDQVKKGQPILRFSKEKIAKAGHSDMVCVLLTNSDDYEDVKIGADAE